jgi:hypothetical protein
LPAMSAALAVMDRMERLYGLNEAQKLDVGTTRETVILADGDKESYIKALEEAGQRLSGAVSSFIPEEDEQGDDDVIDAEQIPNGNGL